MAKLNNVDALITISNEFTVLPTHHPITLSKSELKGISVYHWSWYSAVTHAFLTEASAEFDNPTQKYILREFLRYFGHDSVGVREISQMNAEWRDVVQDALSGAPLTKTSEPVQNTVSTWHQESRNICLIMSRELGVHIPLEIPGKYRNDPSVRMKDDAEKLAKELELSCTLKIPAAVSSLIIVAGLLPRSISCTMGIDAIQDRKSIQAQVNWLLNQIKESEGKNIYIRAWHKNARQSQQVSLSILRDNSLALIVPGKDKILFSRFEVAMIVDLAGKFAGSKTFIQYIEKMVPDFYAEIGQRLRAWVAPAPKSPTKKEDPTPSPSFHNVDVCGN